MNFSLNLWEAVEVRREGVNSSEAKKTSQSSDWSYRRRGIFRFLKNFGVILKFFNGIVATKDL